MIKYQQDFYLHVRFGKKWNSHQCFYYMLLYITCVFFFTLFKSLSSPWVILKSIMRHIQYYWAFYGYRPWPKIVFTFSKVFHKTCLNKSENGPVASKAHFNPIFMPITHWKKHFCPSYLICVFWFQEWCILKVFWLWLCFCFCYTW